MRIHMEYTHVTSSMQIRCYRHRLTPPNTTLEQTLCLAGYELCQQMPGICIESCAGAAVPVAPFWGLVSPWEFPL